jgi:hypothetical protein
MCYQKGESDPEKHYTGDSRILLDEIGYRPRELFDFVEDFCDGGNPTIETALLIASVRREYFHVIQQRIPSTHILRPQELPGRDSELGGITWLPRITAKARAKLKGELDPDIMYCCGGDRSFLVRHDIHPADFLRAVWTAGCDDDQILAYVRTNSTWWKKRTSAGS